MQPTHARWEVVPPSEDSKSSNQLVENMSSLQIMSGNTPKADEDDEAVNDENGESGENQLSQATPAVASMMPPVPSIFTRRFAITDIHYETPETSTLGRPGPDGDVQDIGSNGIISMANPQHPEFVSAEILAELPPECKEALMEAAMKEYEWKSKWQTESTDAARGHILQSYNWHP